MQCARGLEDYSGLAAVLAHPVGVEGVEVGGGVAGGRGEDGADGVKVGNVVGGDCGELVVARNLWVSVGGMSIRHLGSIVGATYDSAVRRTSLPFAELFVAVAVAAGR